MTVATGSPVARVRAAHMTPHLITLRRPTPGSPGTTTTLDPQKCRVGTHTATSERTESGAAAVLSVRVYGPPELNIRRGDVFRWPDAGGIQYRVTMVEPVNVGLLSGPTLMKAYAEAMEG